MSKYPSSLVAVLQIRSVTRHPGSFFFSQKVFVILGVVLSWESVKVELSFRILC